MAVRPSLSPDKPAATTQGGVTAAETEPVAPPDGATATYIHILRDGSASLVTIAHEDLELLFNDGALVPVARGRARSAS